LQDWIIESHDIAEKFIYAQLKYNGKPTENYLEKAYEIVKKRIGLGGYRLAKIIKNIKNSFDDVKYFDKKRKGKDFLEIIE